MALQVQFAEAESSSSTRRIYIHPSTLRACGATAGAPVGVVLSRKGEPEAQVIVLSAWPQSSLDGDGILLPQEFNVEEPPYTDATLLSLSGGLPSLAQVSLRCPKELQTQDDLLLAARIRAELMARKYVAPNQVIPVEIGDEVHRVVVADIELSKDSTKTKLSPSLPQEHIKELEKFGQVTRSTLVKLRKEAQKSESGPAADAQMNGVLQKEAAYATLGGLDRQIEELRQLVELPLKRPEIFTQYGLRPPRGLLLFGPPGTGKTTLAYSAAKACVSSSSIFTISGPELTSSLHGGTERALRRLFAKARHASPSVIIIDEIDALAPRRDGDAADGAGEVEKRVVAMLLTLMDGLSHEQDARTVVIAATNRPNAIDPALRRPGRLDKEIEVGMPSSEARLAILQVLLKDVPHNLSGNDIAGIASRTHGYVGADLSSLVREAGMHAIQRAFSPPERESLDTKMNSLKLSNGANHSQDSGKGLVLADFTFAQTRIRPSAMREITLEMPKVSWKDIAPGNGGREVQQRVRECVEWPLKYRDTMQALGIEAPRGVLLYGPPGCSKTLIARALASESGLNFVAVKGPELLNKYVGESERALREVFRKARAASPSIVFFDEIDGMTTTRGAEAGGAGDKLIATLLNEMDGIEQLSNVLIVAATNRPDVLDPALLRPGRLDRLLYVGPPDPEARRQILQICARKMSLAEDVDIDTIAQRLDGCSGAEVVSVCQDAGLRAMNEDVHARCVRYEHFAAAAENVRRRITPQMLRQYEAWRDQAT